jgi:hypothetical protein
MEEDFGRAVAEGMANAGDEDDSDDENEAVEVEILNHEQGEVVGTIDTDGNLDTESEALRTVSQEYLEEDVPVLVPTTYENEDVRRFTPTLRCSGQAGEQGICASLC